jgi:hypothetical protein
MQDSSSSPEPRRVEDVLEEPNEPTSPTTDEDLSSSFTIGGWTPFEPRQLLPHNTLNFTSLPVDKPFFPFPPLPPILEMATVDITMNNNNSEIKEVKLNLPKPFDGKQENLQKLVQDGELYLMRHMTTTSRNGNFLVVHVQMRCCLLERTAA